MSKRKLINALLDLGDPNLDLRMTLEISTGEHGEGSRTVDVEFCGVRVVDVDGRLVDTMELRLCDPLPLDTTRGPT